MLNRMHRVMESQLCFVKGNPSLRAAHRRGCIEWRDFYGGVTMKEIFAHLTRGDVLHAVSAFATLLWYVRGRVFIIPWKYRERVLSEVRRRLGIARFCRPQDQLEPLTHHR